MKPLIVRLENSVHYYLHCVFIIVAGDEYRLVVIHNDKVITDSAYHSLRGAKIAFSQLYCQQMCNQEVKPSWTKLYQPENEWYQEKMDLLLDFRSQQELIGQPSELCRDNAAS